MEDQLATSLSEQLLTKLDYIDETKGLIADAIKQAGASVSSEATFRDYANIISTLGVGNVLLFKTISEMHSYSTPSEGDLAVIYQSNEETLNLSDAIRYIRFPLTATTQIEIASIYSLSIFGNSIIGNITLTPTYMTFRFGTNINIEYASTDGINYTRTTSVPDLVDLGEYVHIEPYYYYSDYILAFIRGIRGTFDGLYNYSNGEWTTVINQFTIDNANQILTNYTAYGKNNIVTGDGTYISNIKANEFINKYMPSIQDNTETFNVIQSGTPAKTLDYVQREQISIEDAYSSNIDATDCIVQISSLKNISVNNGEYATLINNYLNCASKQNYSFYIDDTAYRLYLGYNYNTTQHLNAFTNNYDTVPYQMTSLYAFIINLEDLSVYKTFQNNESWVFTNNGFGSLLTYAYSIKSDCLVLVTDMKGWLSSDGAYIGLTTINTNGTRITNYYTINYSTEYTYKSIAFTSYDNDQDCYYLAYKSAQTGGSPSSIKRICKLTPSGTLSSIYESAEDMKYISALWSSYFKNIDSLICYTTDNKGTVLLNLRTGNEINLYGSNISNSGYFGIDANNLYLSHKLSDNDTYYDIYAINKNTLEIIKIYETHSTSRLFDCFYTYNRKLAIFYNNNIISTSGEILNHFNKSMLANPSISGIDFIDNYGYKSSFIDYNLNLTQDKITAQVIEYKYYKYSDITNFPIQGNLCIMANSKTSTLTNNTGSAYKYKSLIVTDVEFEDVDEAIAITERILGNSSPSDVAKYIKSLQDLIDQATELTTEVTGDNEN